MKSVWYNTVAEKLSQMLLLQGTFSHFRELQLSRTRSIFYSELRPRFTKIPPHKTDWESRNKILWKQLTEISIPMTKPWFSGHTTTSIRRWLFIRDKIAFISSHKLPLHTFTTSMNHHWLSINNTVDKTTSNNKTKSHLAQSSHLCML